MAKVTGAATGLLPLHNLENVNTVLGLLYDSNGVYRAAFEPGVFYDTILLDTLRYGEENYVHLKYAENLAIRRGDTLARFRRWAGLTPTLTPLREGVPPAPDKHAYETIEVGNVFSFGRWSEYTDRVNLSVINEVIAERSVHYGQIANETKELYARKTWLASPNEFYANFKTFNTLAFGDVITLDDLRFLVARMKRMMVKPVGGKFNYICSGEFINGLVDDPRVKQYMAIEQTTGKLWGSGEPFDMFELSFIPTMLDEFAYPDTEFPGVYELANGKEVIRLYAINASNVVYYLDIHQDFKIDAVAVKDVASSVSYLPDGSAIENKVTWTVPTVITTALAKWAVGANEGVTPGYTYSGDATQYKAVIKKHTREFVPGTDTARSYWKYPVLSDGEDTDVAKVNTLLAAGAFMQLPVHRGILFGMEAMVKLTQDGISDAPQIIIKALGSAGVSDPLDQRQSVGFKVDGFGLAIKRPEAICITYSIPKFAEMAALTSRYIGGDWITMDGLVDDGDKANRLDNYGNAILRVDGVNAGGYIDEPNMRGYTEYPLFATTVAYAKGDKVAYQTVTTVDGKSKYVTHPYEFTAAHAAGAWTGTDVKKVKYASLETNLLDVVNDPDSNVK